MFSLLSYPVTHLKWKEIISSIIGIGVFILLFIVIFSPFDFHLFNLRERIEWGLVVATIVMISEALVMGFVKWITDKKNLALVVWHQLLSGFSIILLCSQLIYIYTIVTGMNAFSFKGSLIYLGSSAPIAFFPLTAGLILRIKKSNLEEAHLAVKDGNLIRNIPLKSIVLIKAYDNYLKIYWSEDPGTIQLLLTRSTLTEMEARLKDQSNFLRCHRSYIINIDKITGRKGNSTKLLLLLKNYDSLVPVSRELISEIRELTSA